MLTETFVASISAPTKAITGVTKDVGIFVHELQPLPAPRHVFKKSATQPNCLAVSASHVFAAQAEKAVVHVYSREKGNQEAIVPFPDRVYSIALAANDTVLLLGTASGRILVWEICTGRLVSTSTSHLQRVTALAVDPSSNVFLSGSADSMIHVWSLPTILSFSPDTSRSPMHTLSTHRGAIASLVCGHSSTSANIAVSISEDRSAIVWDYRNAVALRTYLLPEVPAALALDPADRAVYVGYADGSLQTLSFYEEEPQATAPSDLLRDPALSHRPLQPSPKTRFDASSQNLGAVHSLGLSWDGTTLLSGHASGKIASWDLAKRTYSSTIVALPGPVNNIQLLPPTGFPNSPPQNVKIHTVAKPRHDLAPNLDGNGMVPPNYGFNVQFTSRLSAPAITGAVLWIEDQTEFELALTHPSFPSCMLEEGLLALQTWGGPTKGGPAGDLQQDFVSFTSMMDEAKTAEGQPEAQDLTNNKDFKELKRKYEALQRVQKATFEELYSLKKDKAYLSKQERVWQKRKMDKAARGEDSDEDVEMDDGNTSAGHSEDEETSSGSGSGSDGSEEEEDG